METVSPGDQYNLKWNNHLANFVQTFIEHQNQESLVDVTLSCEGQYIKAHKLILSACSDYFHSIFQVHGNVQYPFIFLNGVRFVDLKYILHFMYHGEVKVVDKDLPNVLALGESLQIKGLSSVKLRDMTSEEDPVSQPKKAPTKIVQSRVVNPPTPLPSEIPYFSHSINNKSNLTSNKTYVENLPSKLLKITKEIQCKSNVQAVKQAVKDGHLLKEESTWKKIVVISEAPPVTNDAKSTNNDVSNDIKGPVPKPPNAFMLFANEWRKKLTIEHPEENNKEISVRLGNMWKNVLPEDRNIYYAAAKRGEEEHKAKYPNYVHSTNNVGKRKSDVLNDSTNTTNTNSNVDPMEVVEIQEQICVSDSE